MSEMIERVALAIDGAMFDSVQMPCGERQAFVARAAIEAMREPTNAMHKAGNDKMDSMVAGDGDAFCEHVWRLMIDAALSEKP
jgi:hypothetical protein